MFSTTPSHQKPNIAVIGTWDTKGPELHELVRLIEAMGCITTKINIGIFEPVPQCRIDINLDKFVTEPESLQKLDRPTSISLLKKGIAKFREKHSYLEFDAIIGPGGTNGTELITTFMHQYPDIPCVCLSTVAQHENYSYTLDNPRLHLVNTISDIGGGVNSILRPILQDVVGALIGRIWMQRNNKYFALPAPNIKGAIAASQFGTTTPCVQRCATRLAKDGYETVIFHMVGSGGRTMEKRIRKGEFSGLLEITPTELADLYGNGVFSAGESRLSAAAEMGIPQVFAPGCLDMINLGQYEEVIKDPRFKDRTLHKCNQDVTVMRTTMNDYQLIARHIVEKLKNAKNKVIMLLPKKGLSKFDSPSNSAFPWYDPLANAFLFAEIKRLVRRYHCSHIEIHEVDHHINDVEFADFATSCLLAIINKPSFNVVKLSGQSVFKENFSEVVKIEAATRPRTKSLV